MVSNIVDIVKSEIDATSKERKPLKLHLLKAENGDYCTNNKLSIEGEYLLSAKDVKEQIVQITRVDQLLVITGIDCVQEKIIAFVSKDENVLLSAAVDNLKADNLEVEPSFIIGPPGTGKTKVITKALEWTYRNNLKVLMVSPTNMAVENVFEKIDLEKMNMKEGDVVLTIKTENKELEWLNSKTILKRRLEPLEDELSVLQESLHGLFLIRRDLEPELTAHDTNSESLETSISNYSRDLEQKRLEQKSKKSKISSIAYRKEKLSKNSLLAKMSKFISNDKLEDLNKEEESLKRSEKLIEEKIEELEEKIKSLLTNNDEAIAKSEKTNTDYQEASKNIDLINKRIEEVRKEIYDLKTEDVFGDAKIVGATLVSSSLKKQIQSGEFDMIIVDEASMALVPYLAVTSQALNEKVLNIKYEDDEELTVAQNEAVKLILKSKFNMVGDPRQLSGIAKTYEMKKSIFAYYGIEKIFEGESVKNTVFLDINFRNHPDIVSLVSKMFYGGMLKAGKEHNGKNSLFIKNSTSVMVSAERSYVNHGNVVLIEEQIRLALSRGRRSIGVITPYKKQAELIEEMLTSLRVNYPDADMQAGTIHKFQGKEKDIIIFDLTFSPRNSMDKLPIAYQGDNLSEAAKLLNVATTRAEQFFILVGNIKGSLELENQESSVYRDWVKQVKYLSYKTNTKKEKI